MDKNEFNHFQFDDIQYMRTPFPHCVIESFFEENVAELLLSNIESLKLKDSNHQFVNKFSSNEFNKFAFSDIEKLPPQLKDVFLFLNSKEFVANIEKLTGISDIIYGDCNLRGAGVHIIKKNGFLKMHTDFNTYIHPEFGKLDRRINLLLYMNKNWKSEYKGDLILYNPNNKQEIKRVTPSFNRCVIFNTTNKSVHGHPEALNVPSDDMFRKSIAVYYYTKNKNKDHDFEGDPTHSTIWHKDPDI